MKHNKIEENKEKGHYALFAEPGFRVDYAATENVNLFLMGGARIENIHGMASEAQGWEWQPVAAAGFKVQF